MMYSNYFFDLYGTLADIRTDENRPSFWKAMSGYLSLCGAEYSPSELKTRYLTLCAEETESLAALHPELGEEGVEIELRRVFSRLFEEKKLPVSDERLSDTAAVFRALSYCRVPRLMRGAARTLSGLRLRGARIYLLSNAQSCFTTPEIRRLGLENAFDGIFLSSDFGCRKPAPAFFRAALSRAGVSPSEALMVGNDPVADIQGADAIGMESRYLHSWQSPPRGAPLPPGCLEISALTDLL